MAAQTTFRNSALISGLVTAEQLTLAEANARAALPPPMAVSTAIDDDMLANQLVEMALLTPYQADQLKNGRTKLNLGPYMITDWIGQGGMGQVFKAVHKMMGRECAVKVLPMHKATPESIANFTREIRTQAQLDHPHLVRAYDAGHDGKVHYLVTEYVPGTDLRRLVRSRGTLTVQQAAKVILQAALGLAYAHNRGLIHRDVKPGNILVTPEGVAKVSDLGLAGFMDEGDLDPRAGKIVGTADYLSPEQIRTPREVTKASDIYSLGCTLYYAVCGKVPFPGGTTRDKARRHCEETPWHPRRFNPELTEEFVEIIADMMEKDPAARVRSAEEVVARLEPWAKDAGPLLAQQLSKARWMAPPPPEDDVDEMYDDHPNSEIGEGDSRSIDSPSQYSQPTESGISRQDTRTVRPKKRTKKPLLNFSDTHSSAGSIELDRDEQWSVGLAVAMALAIAVPVSMLLGAALTFLLLRLLG
ncbi:MAG: serine/threonine-protein kinase [Pirellulales bacterium]